MPFIEGAMMAEPGLYERAATYHRLRAEHGRPIPDLVRYMQMTLGK